MRRFTGFPFLGYEPMYDAEGAGGGGGGNPPPAGDPPAGDPPKADPAPNADPPKVEFTVDQQAKIDKLVTDRLQRAQTKWEADAAEAKRREQLTDAEKAKAAQADAEAKATEATSKANTRMITSEVRVLAKELGIDAPAAKLMKLLDISDVKVDDSTDKVTGVKEALTALLAEIPSLKTTAQAPAAPKSGSEFNGDVKIPLTMEAIKSLTPAQINDRWAEISVLLAASK